MLFPCTCLGQKSFKPLPVIVSNFIQQALIITEIFYKYLDKINYTKVIANGAKRNEAIARAWDCFTLFAMTVNIFVHLLNTPPVDVS
ncbi:MAG: hypothetical protein AAFX80_16310 [Cyanobacteria bacterium J06639_18]